MLTLLLLLTASPALSQKPRNESKEEVAFRLGPAAATARRELVDGQIHVVLTVTNDTDAPLWWRGAGIGCIGSGMWTPPLDEAGRPIPEFDFGGVGCTMERDRRPTPEQLEEWSIAPGETRSEVLRPFWHIEEWDEGRDLRPKIPTLSRWVYWHEVTLPRATPPPSTMNFECPDLLVAWDRSLGVRVFVEGSNGDVHLPQFDPFDETPFMRDQPVPVHIGPLIGTAELTEGPIPEVILRLRNPTGHSVSWSRATAGTCWWEGFLADDVKRDDELGVKVGVSVPDLECTLAPGASRTMKLLPFDDPEEAIYPPNGRWHWVADSTWPVFGDAPKDGWPKGVLHVVWDPKYGLAVALRREIGGYEPFRYADVFGRSSAAVRVGEAWLIAEALRGVPSNLEIRTLPVHDQCYALWDFSDLASTEEFRWEEEPHFAELIPWHEPDPEVAYSKPGDWMDWIVHDGNPMSESQHKARPNRTPLMTLDPGLLEAPWEWRRVMLVPRADPPRSSRGMEAVRLTVRWSEETGLVLSAEPAPPQQQKPATEAEDH